MARKDTSQWNARSHNASIVAKSLVPGALAAGVLGVVAWLVAATIAPAPKNVLAVDMRELMRGASAVSAAPAEEWRAAGAASPEREYPRGAVARAAGGAAGDVFAETAVAVKFPQAGRELLGRERRRPASGFAALSPAASRMRSAAAPESAAPRPPRIALAIARAGIEQPPVALTISEVAGESVAKRGAGIASASALASAADGMPELSLDDLFTLKLRGEYGTSKATAADGDFRDRFLVLGGKKRFDFAGMDQVDVKGDVVFTTSGNWDNADMTQDLSGIALSVGPEIKFPELPVKLDINAGIGWLTRESTLRRATAFGDRGARADIDSLVYGGGAALKSDWQWRMLTVTGSAGVQYTAADDKAHRYEWTDAGGNRQAGGEVEKVSSSAWDLPLQVRFGGEYRLLNALSVLPSLWGGYTYNITGKNGAFLNGHIAGAESTWRRNGMTWNKSHFSLGGELRLRAVDRFELWLAHQKEWAGDDSGSYTGGGLQIAF